MDVSRDTSPLTAITPVIPGREPVLRAVLESIAQRIASGSPTSLDSVATVHFARWALLEHPARNELLFTSDFDGSWDDYIHDFVVNAADSFDAIYSNCEGYPISGARDEEAFKSFVRKHEVHNVVYYQAYPNTTVKEVKRALRLARGLRDALRGLQELS
jgi:hypothetical protein